MYIPYLLIGFMCTPTFVWLMQTKTNALNMMLLAIEGGLDIVSAPLSLGVSLFMFRNMVVGVCLRFIMFALHFSNAVFLSYRIIVVAIEYDLLQNDDVLAMIVYYLEGPFYFTSCTICCTAGIQLFFDLHECKNSKRARICFWISEFTCICGTITALVLQYLSIIPTQLVVFFTLGILLTSLAACLIVLQKSSNKYADRHTDNLTTSQKLAVKEQVNTAKFVTYVTLIFVLSHLLLTILVSLTAFGVEFGNCAPSDFNYSLFSLTSTSTASYVLIRQFKKMFMKHRTPSEKEESTVHFESLKAAWQ